jgi:uncharacterized repeat protein (TIGR01451 family)
MNIKNILIVNAAFLFMLNAFLIPALSNDTLINIENFSSLDINKIIKFNNNSSNKNISYIITVKNSGEIFLKNVTITDAFPANIEYIHSSYLNSNDPLQVLSFERNENGTAKKIVWHIGNLETGEEKQIELIVQNGSSNGSADFYANKALGEGEALGIIIKSAAIEAIKSEDEEIFSVYLGPRIDAANGYTLPITDNETEYTLVVTNSGGEPLENIILTAELPKGMRFISSNPEPAYTIENPRRNTTLVWTFDELPVAESQAIFMTVDNGGNIEADFLDSIIIQAIAKFGRQSISSDMRTSFRIEEAT